MAYLVLARKWRPQNFTDLIGQEHVSQTLANAIRSGRIHHAFLFTGARGVGKTSAARILAKALNCDEGLSDQPCGSCSSCTEITAGQGLDVIEIDGASNTGVDDVRELRENIRYLPNRSRFKIFIIDEVHMLSTNAFNALLKTLEEPPEHAKFIFATTEPHKIPITILSRCQRFDFRKIPLARVASRMREISDAEQLTISDHSLSLVARQGEGSMRDALSTLDQVIAFSGEQVDDEAVQTLLGMVDRRLLLDTVEAVLQRDSRRALDAVRRVDQLGLALRRFTQDLLEMFRGMVICKVVEDPAEMLDLVGEELKELKSLAEEASLDDLQRIVTLLMKTQTELVNSSFPLLTLEMSLVRLATLAPTQDLAKLINHIESLEKRMGSTPLAKAQHPVQRPTSSSTQSASPAPVPAPTTPIPSPDPPPKKPEAPVATSTESKGWQGLVEQVKQSRPMLGSVLEHGRLLKLEIPVIEIGYAKGSFMISQLQEPDISQDLDVLITEYFGQPVKLRILAVDIEQQSTAPPSLVEEREAKETDRMRRLREDAMEHPALKSVQDIFKGEIKKVIPIDKGFV
ncbi:DNA polymerase III subunit gamma/tau [Deltaproteobacteria bacterium IMCC39524]|nr:DNA polymerase III subunit gamma/tau [Deltaproteobacteria bacterium IMCC39524]